MTKLFVGNLPFTVTDTSLNALFGQHGKVESAAVIMDRETGKPRGFGFVEMSASDAARAMQSLNGHDFEGHALKVNEAQERAAQGGRRGGPRRH